MTAEAIDITANLHEYVRFAEVKRLLDRLMETSPSRLAVLSLGDGEGKTFLTATLAMGLAFHLHKRVLVVDAGLGESGYQSLTLTEALGAPSQAGKADTAVPGVGLLNLDSSEYDIESALEQYRDDFDVVVVDTRSLTARNRNNFDPLVLARRLGNAVLVTHPDKRPSSWGDEVISLFQGEPVRLLGVVDNRGNHDH